MGFNITGQTPYNLDNLNFKKLEGRNFDKILIDINNYENKKQNWLFNYSIKKRIQSLVKFFNLKYALRKIAFDDTLSISDLPISFQQNFILTNHVFGITLSVDQIGSECSLSQLSTLGSNFNNRAIGEASRNFKPRLGHFVCTYPGSVISGPISIGHCTIIASNAIVTKNVPSFTFVKGVNQFSALTDHHKNIFLNNLNYQLNIFERPKASMVYSQGEYFINKDLSRLKKRFVRDFQNKSFSNKAFFKELEDLLR